MEGTTPNEEDYMSETTTRTRDGRLQSSDTDEVVAEIRRRFAAVEEGGSVANSRTAAVSTWGFYTDALAEEARALIELWTVTPGPVEERATVKEAAQLTSLATELIELCTGYRGHFRRRKGGREATLGLLADMIELVRSLGSIRQQLKDAEQGLRDSLTTTQGE